MQVTTGKRYVSDGAATGKWQMAAGSIRYCRYKKLCFSAQLTGFRNRYGLDISGQKFLQTWQVLRVDAGEHLEDAGCETEMIRDFLGWFDKGQQTKQLELLERQREYLLGRVHTDERRISCLDYLIYQIQGKPAGKR